jgi:hypothetical protein
MAPLGGGVQDVNAFADTWGGPVREVERRVVASGLGREHGAALSVYETGAMLPFFDATDGRVYALTASNVMATSGAPEAARSITLHAHLDPGTYVLLAAPQHTGQEAGFGLFIESTEACVVQQLWPPKGAKDKAAMTSGAGDAVRKGLESIYERVLSGSVQGKEASKKASALLRQHKRAAAEQKRLRDRIQRTARPAGMDDASTGLHHLSRFLTHTATAIVGVPWGLAGTPAATHAALRLILAAEAKAVAVGEERRRLLRAKCIFYSMRDSVEVLPPIRQGQMKYAAAREMEKEQATRSALEQVAGTASDPEVALLLTVLDLPQFRYRGEKPRVTPGLEVLSSLPMNLERLSAPIEGPEAEVRRLDEAAFFHMKLEEHLGTNKKLDEEDTKERAKELVAQRAKERSEAAVKATLEAEKKALNGGDGGGAAALPVEDGE